VEGSDWRTVIEEGNEGDTRTSSRAARMSGPEEVGIVCGSRLRGGQRLEDGA